MLRDTQIKHNHGRPTKTASDQKIKAWMHKNFKESWWGYMVDNGVRYVMDCDRCPQKAGIKPCWNCKRWNSWIKDYKKGLVK